MMTTVLPTPAPPNNPILPPFTNGAIRSMTLMPVSNTSVFGSRSTNFGVPRWIGQRSASGGIGARSEEHTSELQSLRHLVCRLLLEKKKKKKQKNLQGNLMRNKVPVVNTNTRIYTTWV